MTVPDWAPVLLAALPAAALAVMVFAVALLFSGAVLPGVGLMFGAVWAAYVAAVRRALLSGRGL